MSDEKPKRARRARKSKVRQPSVEASPTVMEVDAIEDAKPKTTFLAILQTSHTYDVAGEKFFKGIPKPVPNHLRNMLINNGNFIIP